jgi:hypothetical protein
MGPLPVGEGVAVLSAIGHWDVPEEECPTDGIDYLDDRLGKAGSSEPIDDDER